MRRPEVYSARKLRREMSLPEVLLWQRLRGSAAGAKFRRQHPIGRYVVDFFCREAALIVEVDGEAHNRGNRPERDTAREAFLKENGYRVLHIAAADILRDADAVADQIATLISSPERGGGPSRSDGGGGSPPDVTPSIESPAAPPLHHPADGPPPRAGEDR